MTYFRNNIVLIVLLASIGFSIYAVNLNNPLFWDDDDWILQNQFVHSFDHFKDWFTKDILSGFGLRSNYFRPFLLLTFALNYAIGKAIPLTYHLVNNGFHIANGILIFYLLFSVFKNRIVPFLAALLFIIHPVQVEAVTYISGRGDPMSVFFMLLALLLFTKAEQGSRRTLFKSISFISLILGILSRESAVIFPLLLMVFYISFMSRSGFLTDLKRAFVKALPYFGIAGIYTLLRLTVFNFKNTLNFFEQSNIYTEHLTFRIYTFFHAVAVYIKLIFVPLGLHMERDLPVATSPFVWPIWLVALGLVSLIWFLFYLYKKETVQGIRNRIQNSPFRIWFFAWFWFFISLGPVSGITPINAFLYEHWLYLPLIGFFTLGAFYLHSALNRLKGNPLYYVFITLLIGYFTFFAVASLKRSKAWGNPVTFYEDTLKYSPKSVRINNNLGNLYQDIDREKSKFYYLRAIEFEDIFAQPHYNLANILRDEGKIEEVIKNDTLKTELGIQAHQTILFNFDFQTMIKQYEALLSL